MTSRLIPSALFILTLSLATATFAQRPGPPNGRPGGFPGGPGPVGPEPGPGGRPRPPRGDIDRPPRGPRPPLGPQADFLSSEMRFGDRVVKGSPYSAQFSTESTQVLADGTRITRNSNGVVYRNGDGRTRREQKLGALGPIPIEGKPRELIFINDPVAGAHYVIDVQERSARKLPFRESPPASSGLPPAFQDSPDPVTTESLGKQMIEGVEAEGTRATITIPAGRIGNDRPLKIVSERWYSPELQIVVLSKHSDPFAGENVYRLTGINRGEPSPALFEVPADYRVIEGHPEPPRRPLE
jgi:hypothetical protein